MESYVNEKLKELDRQLTEYLKKYKKFDRYLSQNSIIPPQASELKEMGKKLSGKLSSFKERNNLFSYDQLIIDEMLRHVSSITLEISNNLERTKLNPDDIINYNGIPRQDLDRLETWLKENQTKIKNAVKKDFELSSENVFLIPEHIFYSPAYRSKIEKLGNEITDKYHKTLGNLVSEKTGIKDFNKRIEAITTHDTSYFN